MPIMHRLRDYRLNPPEPPAGYEGWRERQLKNLKRELESLLRSKGWRAVMGHVRERWPEAADRFDRGGIDRLVELVDEYDDWFSVEEYREWCEARWER